MTGGCPEFGTNSISSPFLARKGDRGPVLSPIEGMVETVNKHAQSRGYLWSFNPSIKSFSVASSKPRSTADAIAASASSSMFKRV